HCPERGVCGSFGVAPDGESVGEMEKEPAARARPAPVEGFATSAADRDSAYSPPFFFMIVILTVAVFVRGPLLAVLVPLPSSPFFAAASAAVTVSMVSFLPFSILPPASTVLPLPVTS